jgi:hypothetical protein
VSILDSNNILSPNDSPHGLTYEEHAKRFWKHLLSIPSDQSPIKDKTGEKCAVGQENSSSPVFYLVGSNGSKVERTCTIPHGKGVLIPVMVVEVSDQERPNATEEELHKISSKDQDSVTSMYLRVDDKEYDKNYLSKYRIHTDAFDVVFPDNAIYNAAPGKSKAVADGHYILTDVLPKGKHEIHYKSSLTCEGEDCLEPRYEQDIKYTLTVE